MTRFLSVLVGVLVALLSGCASLPSLEGRTPTTSLADTAETRLGRALAPAVAANPGKTGIHPLPNAYDAFAARVLIAAAADKSLDAQYYIWDGDQVGFLLFEALWQAAERGVRVRLLLDDINTAGLDPTIAALDTHPNIEVRLYNPLVHRGVRAINLLYDFTRLNRRMHNKSFIADSQVAVLGGRNVGNEYFGAGSGVVYADLDVVAAGAAVREVSKEFDLYWNSPSAYPAASFVGAPASDGAVSLESRFSATRTDPDAVVYLERIRTSPLVRALLGRQLPLEWTSARLVYDDPAKTLDSTARTDILLFPQLVRAIGRPQKTLDLISPYFVPGDGGTASLVALAESGVRVRILTNSLASADANVVQAGYAKRRRDLLRAGVRLYELKATAGRESAEQRTKLGSSSSLGLHAKTMSVDGSRIFIGSFNFDQRSALLNTEMGLVLESPKLAQRLAEVFDNEVPLAAYEVRLAPDSGSLEWIERSASGEKHHDTEPGTRWLQRRSLDMLSILPVDWLL